MSLFDSMRLKVKTASVVTLEGFLPVKPKFLFKDVGSSALPVEVKVPVV